MAYLYRLIALLALLFVSQVAQAQSMCSQFATRTWNSALNTATSLPPYEWAGTKAGACQYSLNSAIAANPGSTATFTMQSFSTQCHVLINGQGFYASDYGTRQVVCPVPEIEACPLPKLRAKDGIRCLTQMEKDCDDRAPNGPSGPLDVVSDSSWSRPSTICDGTALSQQDSAAGYGCTVGNLEFQIGYQPTPTTYAVRMSGKFTGTVCTPSTLTPTGTTSSGTTTTPTVSTPSEEPACPDGQPGTVNGVTVCIPFANAPGTKYVPTTSGDSSTVTNPDGSTTKTDKTTGSTTTCTGTSCVTTVNTTTTVTVTPSGGGTGTSTTTTSSGTKTGTQSGFCTENPKAVICGGEENSSFGGSCTGGFVCTGDAAICAVAKATNEQKCLLDEPSPEAEAYEAAKAANSTGMTTETVAISAASFDTSNALPGGAACITDMNITVMNKSVSLPFSSLCPHLENLGYLLLAVSFLLAVRIVGRG